MYKKAWDKIINARYIVIVSHVYPDGDTIGSTLALFSVLKELGKKAMLYNASIEELPREFNFLDGFSKIQGKLPNFFDLLVCCDCASFDRLGVKKGDYQIVNLDHHVSNKKFGNINVVLENASSAGVVLYKLLKANSVHVSKKTAMALYTSMADDTDFFKYREISSSTFEIASELIKCGADPKRVASKVKSRLSLAKIRLIAYMLSNFDLHYDATVASIVIDKAILKKTGAKRSDTKNIVNMLLDIVNVKVAFVVIEFNEFCKISLRSDGDRDIVKISTLYGGGGHKNAAGFNVNNSNTIATCQEVLNLLR
ncbi:MAG: bifunctional oligoribonuclease/PAP phosphatase NrnA [Sulfurospirillum sp.]|nr:bifunctional oligoribonuclease/PAP phosphatase NrnA [Sulfurospirillum sp.]MBL0702835.1 bifunctional oligoribonuclease/PAP phosphatase NrnA [Sulfurospirillum sp.]